MIDQTHLVCIRRFALGDLDRRARVAYYAGASGWLLAAWIGSQTVAVVLGAAVPAAARLDMVAPFALLGLLAKSPETRPTAVAAVTAAVAFSVGVGLPFESATLVAMGAGLTVAVLFEGPMAPVAVPEAETRPAERPS